MAGLPHPAETTATLSRTAALVAGAAVAAVGAVHLAAWLAGEMSARGVSAITVKTNTALALLLSGVGLVLLAAPPAAGRLRRGAVQGSAALVTALGALTLAEHLTGWYPGLDQLLAREPPGMRGVLTPNRMGVPACIAFLLTGPALLLLGRGRGRAVAAAQWLALVVGALGLLGTIGHLYGAQPLIGSARFTAIAPSTAVSVLVLGLGLLFVRADAGPVRLVTATRPGGRVVRLLLLASVTLPIGLGYLRLLGERARGFDAELGAALLVMAFIVVFTGLVAWAARWLSRSAREASERVLAEERLQRIEWLLRGSGDEDEAGAAGGPAGAPYATIVPDGAPGSILRAVGESTLRGIAIDFMDLLGTATLVQERDGTPALGLSAGIWSLAAPAAAPGASAFRLCRDPCWAEAGRRAVEAGQPIDAACPGGMRIYVVPVAAGAEIVGSIGFGYGDPPRDGAALAALAERYPVSVDALRELAEAYESRPPFLIDVARRRLATSARFVGEIVERRAAEDALRASGARLTEAVAEAERSRAWLAVLFHRAGVGMAEVDTEDDRFLAVNDEALRILGYPREDLIGRTVREITWPADRELSDSVNAAIHSGEHDRIGYEKRYRRYDGTPVWVRVTISAIRDQAGGWLRSITTVEDISQRKAAEDALRESEERFRALADNITQLAWMADGKGRMVWLNRRWFEYTGTSLDDVAGWGWQTVHHPEHVERVVGSLRHSFQTGEPWEETFPLRSKDGEWRWFLSRAVALRDEGGVVTRWFGTSTDITERKEAEEALVELKESLEQRVAVRTAEAEQRAAQLRALALELTRSERRERMRLAKLLHDQLQQILVAAKMRITLAERRLEDGALQRTVNEAGELLAEAIGTSRTITAELSPLVLQDRGLIAALDWLARWMGEKHGLRVEVELDRGAEPADEAVRLTLFEAARELLRNVATHARVRHARLLARRDGHGQVQLLVRDEGRGFEAAEVLAGPSREGRGFGLFGLRERIAWLGGQLVIDAAPGAGTTVTVTVPARLDERVIAPVAAAPARLAELPSGPTDIRVLLVDDHEMVRQGLATMLDFEPDIVVVGEAANGREALRLTHALRPDVVIMDITMPVMDGLEATRRISAEVPGVRVIGVSLHESSDMARAMQEAGAVGFLSKAGPTDRLVHEIRAAARGLPATADVAANTH